MAIGSNPEIGVTFTRWGQMTDEHRNMWFDHMRNNWGANLMGGYATLQEWKRWENHNA